MNTNTELVVRSAKKNMVKCHVGMRNKNRRHCLFALSLALLGLGIEQGYAQVGVNQAVDYSKPNYANSPLLRKFVDSLPGLGVGNSNNLGQYIPVAVPDKATYPGADYYVLGVTQYVERMHSDLPATGTKLRGYVQLNSADPTVRAPHYLGPLIVAQRGTPVRILFTNMLPTSTAGNLFLPVDTTMMGAGTGPMSMGSNSNELYSQNRAEIHLHGGDNPWISDGTPHQWTTPAGEPTSYPKGVGVQDVPDMPAPGPGALTYYFPNNESARLMFYHDHSYGLTRLNVYAGEAAGYLLTDPVEQGLVTSGVIPSTQIPLIIQDKTFVPDPTTLAATDPLWNTAQWGGMGNLWFPHVYMPNQDPASPDGMNAKGRWDYGPWFWPPQTAGVLPGDLLHPTLPTISAVPESFMDTPVINGTAYPYVQVQPKAYRFRILNGCNDRYLNLQLYYADASGTEVKMVPAVLNTNYPATWPTDGRTGGVPDPATAGPNMVQIGTEAGLLPSPVVVTNTPIGYEYDRKSITVLNISTHALLLGSAERADVVIDFSAVPPGSKLILYNDAPAPVPAFDPRVDYYTDDPDFSVTGDDVGGAPSTKPGYGPNTRTLMQFRVAGTPVAPFNLPALQTALPSAFGASQPPLLVNTGIYARIQDQYMNTSGLPQALTNIILTQAGTAYTTPPTITFVSSSGSGAAATATLGPVTALALTFGGSNYITAPTVQITGGGGTGAAGVATITNGVIATLALTNAGSGYTANPTVTFGGGGGTN
ncbi:MAG: hypothetical protein NTY53_07435, partial [Kiritimatiellaeota bacterium]|nr:hypothetical protein [Kiritimatiellota bacterium]